MSGSRRQVPAAFVVARPSSAAGWTLLELLFASSLMLIVSAVVVELVSSGQVAFRTQPEVADLQQRLRVAVGAVTDDLRRAGTGLAVGKGAGSLFGFLPAIRPARRGLRRPDPELSSQPDRISMLAIGSIGVQARLADDLASPYTPLRLDVGRPGCRPGGTCGFSSGMRALIFDVGGVGRGYDVFTITRAGRRGVSHGPPNPPLTRRYRRDASWVAQVAQRTYYHDAVTERLMRYDGYLSDLPLVDGVVGFEVTLYADPDPRSVPPPRPGESSCVYDAGDPPIPLLQDLGGTAPRALTAAQLRDGPVCGVSPNRFDGDLLRIRRVRIRIALRVAPDSLRGTGTPGQGQLGGRAFVPDREVSFDVAPRGALEGRPQASPAPDL